MTHWIWLSIIILTIVWYIIVTVVVSVRGWENIKDMIGELKRGLEITNKE